MYSLIRDKWSKWKVVSSGAVILEESKQGVHKMKTEKNGQAKKKKATGSNNRNFICHHWEHLFWDFFPPKRTSSRSREKFGSWLVKPNIIYTYIEQDRVDI